MKTAILDDYSNAVQACIAKDELDDLQVTVFRDSASSKAALIERLKPFAIVALIQQRTALPADVIDMLPNLRMISQTGRNTSHIDLDACTRRGIAVCARPLRFPTPTAEFTWALILAAVRDIPRQADRLRHGLWQDANGVTLSGRTLGIFGFGNIGSIVAGYGKAFGMQVVCWGRETSNAKARAAGFEIAVSRAEFFSRCDVLSLHLALNAETRGIVTADDLAAMKPQALLVNTSRAALIAPGVLDASLDAGRPGMAAVDVYEDEPVTNGQHPLVRRQDTLCTPHLGYCVDEMFEQLLPPVIKQIRAFASGRPIDVVNAAVPQL